MPRAMIRLPTRRLAHQLGQTFWFHTEWVSWTALEASNNNSNNEAGPMLTVGGGGGGECKGPAAPALALNFE
jgi:hypothetical protein